MTFNINWVKNVWRNKNYMANITGVITIYKFSLSLSYKTEWVAEPIGMTMSLLWLSLHVLTLFHFARRFWNQILICTSLKLKLRAMFDRSVNDRYFLWWNCFSNSSNCSDVNAVRLRRGFKEVDWLRFDPLQSSDSLKLSSTTFTSSFKSVMCSSAKNSGKLGYCFARTSHIHRQPCIDLSDSEPAHTTHLQYRLLSLMLVSNQTMFTWLLILLS